MTKYNLESLGLCPCLVDIEIVDTRNGNESSIVSVGAEACNCEDPARIALQDSATLVLGGDANKKRKLTEKKKMMKKSASFNSGSELFDALLMAAADDNEGGEIVSKEDGAFDCDDAHCDDDTDCGTGTAGAVTTGWPIPYTPGSLRSHIPPHTHTPTNTHTLTPSLLSTPPAPLLLLAYHNSALPPPLSAQKQQRSERKKRGSFNNFFDSFEQDLSNDKKKPFIRRNSVSMILNNPVLVRRVDVDGRMDASLVPFLLLLPRLTHRSLARRQQAQTGAGDRYAL